VTENVEKTEATPKMVLKDMLTQSGALTALLVSKEGHVIAVSGSVSYINTTAMAALVAGMFSATREVAKMVGETQFSILLQQGQTRHLHISLVTEAVMFVVVFEDYQRIGRVRHAARRAGERLIPLLELAGEAPRELVAEAPRFKEYALGLIDSIFETR
jgi:predicted regulator of Ras-like GTPase activity (Roadblock/LC7/MglB family)